MDVRRVRVIVLGRFMRMRVRMSSADVLRSLMRMAVVFFVMGVAMFMPEKSMDMPMPMIFPEQENGAENHQRHGGEEGPCRQRQEQK